MVSGLRDLKQKPKTSLPKGSRYLVVEDLGHKSNNRYGLIGYLDPLGIIKGRCGPDLITKSWSPALSTALASPMAKPMQTQLPLICWNAPPCSPYTGNKQDQSRFCGISELCRYICTIEIDSGALPNLVLKIHGFVHSADISGQKTRKSFQQGRCLQINCRVPATLYN